MTNEEKQEDSSLAFFSFQTTPQDTTHPLFGTDIQDVLRTEESNPNDYSKWLTGNPPGLPFLLVCMDEYKERSPMMLNLGVSPFPKAIKPLRKMLFNEEKVTAELAPLRGLDYTILNSVPIDLAHGMLSIVVISPTGLIFFVHVYNESRVQAVDMSVEHDYFTHRFHLHDSQIMSILVTMKKEKNLNINKGPYQQVVSIDGLKEHVVATEKRHEQQQLSLQLDTLQATGQTEKAFDHSKGLIVPVRIPGQLYKLLDPNTWGDTWQEDDLPREELVEAYTEANAQHLKAKKFRKIWIGVGAAVIVAGLSYAAYATGVFTSLATMF